MWEQLAALPINTLFVQSILREHVDGELAIAPSGLAFHAVHPYGMSLVWGEPSPEWLRMRLERPRQRDEWLQVFPNRWVPWVEHVLGSRFATGDATRCTRVNFAFDRTAPRAHLEGGATITRATDDMFATPGNVVPRSFWRDAAQWQRAGGGFAVLVDGDLAALAFCSYRHGRQLEIGIETSPAHRGHGHARRAAAALIEDCVRRDLEPVWACRYENVASYRLALRLGFVPTAYVPYYRLT